MSRTLYLSPPSFDGFDGGAGARYQARREVTSYWYPTWLAQPAALTPDSKLLDCPPHDVDVAECLAIAKDFDHVIINTSTPSLKNDCKVAEAIKAQKPGTKIGFVGAHTMVLPDRNAQSVIRRLTGLAARNLISPARKLPKTATFRPLPGFPTRTRTAKSNTTPSAR